jgi:hypothetical protein
MTGVGGGGADSAYAVLGVAESAGTQELTRAYWRQARRLHPDVNAAPDAAERFAALSLAYRSALEATSRRGEPSGLEHAKRVPEPQPTRRPPNSDVWLVAGPVRVVPVQERAVRHGRGVRP